MKLTLTLDEETRLILRSIDTSLKLLVDRKDPTPKIVSTNAPKAGIDRLTVVTDELLTKYAIQDELAKQGTFVEIDDLEL